MKHKLAVNREAEVAEAAVETETSIPLKVVSRDPLELPEVDVDVEVLTDLSVRRVITTAETATKKDISPETAPNPRRRDPSERESPELKVPNVKVMINAATATPKVTSPETVPNLERRDPSEREDPSRKVTISAATAMPKVTSPETAPNPRRSVPLESTERSLPVPPLERLAETATKKVTSLEIAPSPRRKELPVSIDLPESPDLATTVERRDISLETVPRLPPLRRRRKARKLLNPRESTLRMTAKTIRMVSTVKISLLMKPEELLRRPLTNSELRSPRKKLKKLPPLLTRLAQPPRLITS
jgi:hypothetical protein